MSEIEPGYQAGGQPPPGWYPSSPGWQRYWDGHQWTEHQAPLAQASPVASGQITNDDKTMGLLIHLGGAFLSIILPIVLFAVKKDESPYIRHHALEAINFHITVYIAMLVSIILTLLLIGILMMLVAIVLFYVLSIVAAIAAYNGEWYRYPLTIRMIT